MREVVPQEPICLDHFLLLGTHKKTKMGDTPLIAGQKNSHSTAESKKLLEGGGKDRWKRRWGGGWRGGEGPLPPGSGLGTREPNHQH